MTRKEKKEAEQAIEDNKYWNRLCPPGWSVIGFTYRQSALFLPPVGNSIEVLNKHVELISYWADRYWEL